MGSVDVRCFGWAIYLKTLDGLTLEEVFLLDRTVEHYLFEQALNNLVASE